MSDEVYYLKKLDGGSGVYKMKRASGGWQVYKMRRPDSTLPAEEGVGGEGATYAWTLYQTPQWTGGYCLSGWNESAGNYTGGYLIYTITNPIYTHAKVVGASGSSGYWLSSDSKYMASIGVKTLLDYDTCGEGGSTIATRQTYANSAAAIAAWPGSSTKVMRIGGDKKIVIGFEGSPGASYTMLFSIYLGYEV